MTTQTRHTSALYLPRPCPALPCPALPLPLPLPLLLPCPCIALPRPTPDMARLIGQLRPGISQSQFCEGQDPARPIKPGSF